MATRFDMLESELERRERERRRMRMPPDPMIDNLNQRLGPVDPIRRELEDQKLDEIIRPGQPLRPDPSNPTRPDMSIVVSQAEDPYQTAFTRLPGPAPGPPTGPPIRPRPSPPIRGPYPHEPFPGISPGKPGERIGEVMTDEGPGSQGPTAQLRLGPRGELPPGFSFGESPPPSPAQAPEGPRLGPGGELPPGFSFGEQQEQIPLPRARPPELGTNTTSPNEYTLPMDPNERAAMAVRRSATGSRPEGRATAAISGVPGAIGKEVNRLTDVIQRVQSGGDPGELAEVSSLVLPGSVARRTGKAIAEAAMTPLQQAQRETGIYSIPRAVEASPSMQAAGQALATVPALAKGSKLREASRQASQDIIDVGERAAARPTGVVPTQNLAGSQVRSSVESELRRRAANDEVIPRNLAGILRGSNEDMIGRIITMASEGRQGANVNMLAQIRSAMQQHPARGGAPGLNWNNVQGAVIDRMGQGRKTGAFDPQTWVQNYGNMSERGKNIVFGKAGDPLRRHLDAIAEISSRTKDIEKFRGRAALGTKLGISTVISGAAWLEPLTVLSTLLPARVLSNSLAKPNLAAPVAAWSRAFEKVLKSTGGARAMAEFTMATRNLNNNLGTDLQVGDIFGGRNGQSVEP